MKQMFLEILQNSQENTCARASFLETLAPVFSCEFCEISKIPFFHGTSLVAASLHLQIVLVFDLFCKVYSIFSPNRVAYTPDIHRKNSKTTFRFPS